MQRLLHCDVASWQRDMQRSYLDSAETLVADTNVAMTAMDSAGISKINA